MSGTVGREHATSANFVGAPFLASQACGPNYCRCNSAKDNLACGTDVTGTVGINT